MQDPAEDGRSAPTATAEPVAPNRLLKSGVSPPGRAGHALDEDAGSTNSSAIGATEDEILRRAVRSGGRDSAVQQPAKRQRLGREQRRGQLVEAAIELIGLLGIPGTTVSKISAAVGLSEMAAYRHFGSKDEILLEASSVVYERLFSWLDSATSSSTIGRFSELGQSHFDTLSRPTSRCSPARTCNLDDDARRRSPSPAHGREQPAAAGEDHEDGGGGSR